MVSPSVAQFRDRQGERAQRDELDSSPVAQMTSAEEDEIHLDINTRSPSVRDESLGSLAPEYLALPPPPEEDTAQSLIPIPSQETDIVLRDIHSTEPPGSAPPDGFALLPPAEHEPTGSNMTTLNQETNLVPWTQSREPI
jgi:hypothetical protein